MVGWYEREREGPEEKLERREKERSEESPATIPVRKGKPRIVTGILARKSGL